MGFGELKIAYEGIRFQELAQIHYLEATVLSGTLKIDHTTRITWKIGLKKGTPAPRPQSTQRTESDLRT